MDEDADSCFRCWDGWCGGDSAGRVGAGVGVSRVNSDTGSVATVSVTVSIVDVAGGIALRGES